MNLIFPHLATVIITGTVVWFANYTYWIAWRRVRHADCPSRAAALIIHNDFLRRQLAEERRLNSLYREREMELQREVLELREQLAVFPAYEEFGEIEEAAQCAA